MTKVYNISKTDIITNWTNDNWAGWHSEKYVKTHTKNKNVQKDSKYLREAILSQFSITTEVISLKDIIENWYNAAWWQSNLLNVINIFDNMYVKRSVKSCGGIYSNWLTRLVQYIITRDAEQAISKLKGYSWNEAGHTYIHTGVATPEEVKPDFTDINGNGVELKVCENEYSILYYYIKKLKNNFEYTKQHDFHGAQKAIFMTKAKPHKLYELSLDSPETLELHIGEDIDISIFETKKGKLVNESDLPAVPKALLFGITPSWSKK